MMFILTTSRTGGVYSVTNDLKKKTVQCFQEREDAERYLYLLEADDYKEKLEVLEVDPDVVALNCDNYGYNYTIVTPDDFVIPPHKI